MKKEAMIKKSVRLPQDIWDVIIELSENYNTTPSTILRIILRKYILDYKNIDNEESN